MLKKSLRHKFLLVFVAFLGMVISFYLYRFIFLNNFREVIPQQIYRSAQPSALHIKSWRDSYHIKSILNLRGNEERGNIKKAITYAKNEGIEVSVIRLSSRRLPTSSQLQNVIQVINNSPKPLLIHCMRGVDRSGLVSAVAVLLNDESIEKAREEFSWEKGFLPFRKQELLKTVINEYESWLVNNNLSTSKINFMRWSAENYHSEPRA